MYVALYRRLVSQLNYEYAQLVDSPVEAAEYQAFAGDAAQSQAFAGDAAAPTLVDALADLLLRFPEGEYTGQKLLFVRDGRLMLSAMAGSSVHEHLGCFVPGLMMLGVATLADRCLRVF
jgi:hypothetical protein